MSKMKYNREESLAYAAARLPACYAVIFRVLKELQIRQPRFQPLTMLDFGAGPGTATWAAMQVVGLPQTDHLSTVCLRWALSYGGVLMQRAVQTPLFRSHEFLAKKSCARL